MDKILDGRVIVEKFFEENVLFLGVFIFIKEVFVFKGKVGG